MASQPEPQKLLPPPPPYSPGEGFCYRPIYTTVFNNPDWKPLEFDRFIPFVKTET